MHAAFYSPSSAAPPVVSAPFLRPLDLWNKRRLALFAGPSLIFPISLAWQAGLALQGWSIHNIDCALRCNVFNLADEALRLGVQPEHVLHAVRVRRAFTPYQILDALFQILDAPEPVGQKRLYFLLAPCKQFFDGDVSREEGAYLLDRLLLVLRRFDDEGRPLLVAERHAYEHPAFPGVFARLKKLSSSLWELEADERSSRNSRSLPRGRARTLKLYQSSRGINRQLVGAALLPSRQSPNPADNHGEEHGSYAPTLFHTN